ncbi:MlaE family lipid ABC transporter permease subunit [Desulfospira joergensenii]|uniref:MlaE family lipid ABC transporter permease subunit n=1 Tax=Desulfospira joergensenii TaxID=53329 RepID=UPI0003B72A26|nr:MlaE family lipid ABC transporter permease subunit [Desulfospira joergensenii]
MEPETLPNFKTVQKDDSFILALTGRLDAQGSAGIWKNAIRTVETAPGNCIILDLEKVDYLDTAGAVLISRLRSAAEKKGNTEFLLRKPAPEFSPVLDLAEKREGRSSESGGRATLSFIEKRGEKLAEFLQDAGSFITFTGEIFWALISSLRHPGQIRWADTLRVAERSGVDALPIVALISFIVGLVMAFQAAIPMKMFGAEIYVANLIGIAMVRELGPLMTAIVLAGRSASAFAAEIGTMKINEEIDALTIMGLEPVRFLILPRVIASTLVTPLLTLFANLVGILGGAVVILSFDYPFVTYYNQVAGFVTWQDFVGGIVKCFVFGILIAATGCIRGYQTGQGASAVGEATTRAVVSSIILIAVFDGIFSVVYYSLGI